MNVATQSFSYDVFLTYNSAQKDWTRALARRFNAGDPAQVALNSFVLESRDMVRNKSRRARTPA